MNWNLEGKTITGLYMGLFPFKGVVTLSRVKYGKLGTVCHKVNIEEPIHVYGAIRTTITVEMNNVSRIIPETELNGSV